MCLFQAKGEKMNSTEKKELRIEELEEKARRKYIEYSDWKYVIDCLDDDEQKEYKKLMKQVYEVDYDE